MRGPRLIHLVDAAKSFDRPGISPVVVFLPCSVSLPADRRLVVLAERRAGKTTLLQVLAGAARLTEGGVVGNEAMSPVVNAGGLMHPGLSALDNLRFIARAYGFGFEGLLAAVDALGQLDMLYDRPLKDEDGPARRNFEAASVFVMPFGCYLVDEFALVDRDLLDRCLALAQHRGAGVVLSTSQPRLAVQYAQAVVTIRDGRIQLFDDPLSGVDSFEAGRAG